MTNRPRSFTPPQPPAPPSGSVPPALNKGTGTRSIGDRLRFWRALAVLLGLLWAVPYAAWKLADWGVPLADVLWWAVGLLLILGIGAVWVGLTFAQDFLQLRAMWTYWGLALHNLTANAEAQRQMLTGYAQRWLGPRPPAKKEPPTVINGQQVAATLRTTQEAAQQATAAVRALDSRLTAWQAEARARVTSVDMNARETEPLPTPSPVAVAYYDGPMHRLVAMALRGEAITVRAMCPTWMSRDQYDRARADLVRAGVLVPKGASVGLCATLCGLSEEAAHTRAVAWLTQAQS